MGRDRRLQTSPEIRAKLARGRRSFPAAGPVPAVLRLTTLCLAALFLTTGAATAAETGRSSGQPLPRFESLKAGEVNYRRGPGSEHAIKWVLRRRHLPVRIIGEFGRWRRVELHTGERGWIDRALLSEREYVITLGEGARLVEAPKPDAREIATIEPTVPMRLRRCQREWCEVEARVGEKPSPAAIAASAAPEGAESAAETWLEEGWVLKRRLWGVD